MALRQNIRALCILAKNCFGQLWRSVSNSDREIKWNFSRPVDENNSLWPYPQKCFRPSRSLPPSFHWETKGWVLHIRCQGTIWFQHSERLGWKLLLWKLCFTFWHKIRGRHATGHNARPVPRNHCRHVRPPLSNRLFNIWRLHSLQGISQMDQKVLPI